MDREDAETVRPWHLFYRPVCRCLQRRASCLQSVGREKSRPYMAANTLLQAGMSTSESVPMGAECLKETITSVLPVRSKPPWNTQQPQTPESFYSRLSP